MKIDRSDPDATVIHHRPLFVPGFGLVFVLAGLWALVRCFQTDRWSGNDVFGVVVSLVMGGGLFLYTARRDSYRFDRTHGRFSWTRSNLFGTQKGKLPLDDVEAVIVECGPESDSTTYRVVLRTRSHGRLPLTGGYTCGEEHHREVARAIEAVLPLAQQAS